jgi:hypothetical protein
LQLSSLVFDRELAFYDASGYHAITVALHSLYPDEPWPKLLSNGEDWTPECCRFFRRPPALQ